MRKFIFLGLILSFVMNHSRALSQDQIPSMSSEINYFLTLLTTTDKTVQDYNLNKITETWTPSYEVMTVEIMYLGYNSRIGIKLLKILELKTKQDFGFDFNAWYEYLWNKPENLHPDYAYFKSQIYKSIDPRFENYFQGWQSTSEIRLDEIRWGGVAQDGIPPLRSPKMITAAEATYLEDDNVIFGISVNGDVRAYPKRILAWHEMFTDDVGGLSVTGVYCTLCGTVILYENLQDDYTYKLGTSGFLYRSNKLMYDKRTQSLWSTLEGKPVVGALVGQGISLTYNSVVTTTWGDWKARHPQTKVLSLETGHNRDYGEGVAYNEYFSNDDLMFTVPSVDQKLKNKQSIFAIRLDSAPSKPVAISTQFLNHRPIYSLAIGETQLTVFTNKAGANRLYDSEEVVFRKMLDPLHVKDTSGKIWELQEDFIIDDNGRKLARIPAFNAFWFGWQAVYPDTQLIK